MTGMKKIPPLKLKAILLSNDGGRSWLCTRQYYICEQPAGTFAPLFYQGRRFRLVEETEEASCPPQK
jgi:hypothetical protein